MLLKGRGVAQLGSAPAWGAGGRWFESSHPDQLCFSYWHDRSSGGVVWSFDSRFYSNPNPKASTITLVGAFLIGLGGIEARSVQSHRQEHHNALVEHAKVRLDASTYVGVDS